MKKLHYPELYQGKKNPRQYFEGLYLRHTSEDTKNSLIVIPGISYEKNNSHAFIQIITGNPLKAYYIQYDISEFTYSKKNFELKIGSNYFFTGGIHLNIHTNELSLTGELSYGAFSRIDRSLFTPNIMGFFAYFKFMECNHGVVSLSHKITGTMKCNGTSINYDNGNGYIEKDWGISFPLKYIWLQSGHFKKDTNLFVSIARIPFLGFAFNGFISILKINGKQYRFATYNGSKYKIKSISSSGVLIELSRRKLKLIISVKSNSGHVLKAPKRGKMSGEITETVMAETEIELYENGTLIYKDNGTNTGLELVWQ